MSDCPYEIGDTFRFKPSAYTESTAYYGPALDVQVAGTVVRIHEAHRWYRVSYDTPQGVQHETFKF